jgi:hypothetical protein
MQATTVLHPTRQIATAFLATLVVIAVVLTVAIALTVTAPRASVSAPTASELAWRDYRAGERGDTVAPDASEQAYRDYRAGERGDRTQP